jgi:gliding motility-associated-like protein
MKLFPITLSLVLVGLGARICGQTFVFAELQGQPTMVTTGWNLTGSAAVGDTPGDVDNFNNELVLTGPSNGLSGGVFYNQPIDLSICTEWIVNFEFRIFDGNAADGIAFCFLDVPPAGFVGGGGLGIPATANGLKVAFDTFDNGCGPNPEIQIVYGVGYNECAQPNINIVKVNNAGGNLNFIRSNAYNSAQIIYNNGVIQVIVNGTPWLSANFPVNFSGYMGFTASTGAYNDRHSLRNVTIFAPVPPSNAGADVSFCSGDTAQLGTTPNPNFIYSWSPAIGLSDSTIANPTVTLTNTGGLPQQITYTVTTSLASNTSACNSSDQVVVTVYPQPLSDFSVSDTGLCLGETLSVNYTGNMPPGAAYTWNFSGADILSGTLPGQGPFTVAWPDTGSYQVSLSVAQSGCFSSPTIQNITVNSVPSVTAQPPSDVCSGDLAQLTAQSSIPNSVFTWQPGNQTGNPIMVSGTTSQWYSVTAQSPGGCNSLPDSVFLTVKPRPVAQINGENRMCAGDTVVLTGNNSLADGDYIWLPALQTSTQIMVSPSQNQEYGLIIASDGCSSDTAFFQVTVDSVPTVSAPEKVTICKGEEAILTAETTTQGTNFNWNQGAYIGATYSSFPSQSQFFTVFAFTDFCNSDTLQVEVEVLGNCNCELIIPNVFTPNGDNVNDVFQIQNPQDCDMTEFNLVIYNRWGNVVFKANTFDQPWTGKSLFGNSPDGTYFFVITYAYKPGNKDPKSITEKGIITVAR